MSSNSSGCRWSASMPAMPRRRWLARSTRPIVTTPSAWPSWCAWAGTARSRSRATAATMSGQCCGRVPCWCAAAATSRIKSAACLRFFGLRVGKTGRKGFARRVAELLEAQPELEALVGALLKVRETIVEQIATLDAGLLRIAKGSATIRRLMSVPGSVRSRRWHLHQRSTTPPGSERRPVSALTSG